GALPRWRTERGMRKLSFGILVGIALTLAPAGAQRGEFVQTPWPSTNAPTLPARTVIHGTISHFAESAELSCTEIPATPASAREHALAAACRKAFGGGASAVKGSATVDGGACRSDPSQLDSGPRYKCTAPIGGRCRF